MNITAFITNNSIPCWNFNKEHKEIITHGTGNKDITICQTKEEFLEHLPETQIALIWWFEQEWLPLAPKLEWIITPTAGKDYFQVEAPPHLEISYCSFHGEIMAETVLAMMLTEYRGIRKAIELSEKNPWPRNILGQNMRTLKGSHLVILGFGNIGGWIGKLAKNFGVQITGVKRDPGAVPEWFDEKDKIIKMDELKTVLPQADHLVIALPSGEETTNVIGEKELLLLPPHSVIYNVGRGNAIDEEALMKGLKKGKIAAAYLDVFKTEPLAPDSPLTKCPNMVTMPHASAIAPQYLSLFAREFVYKFIKKYGKSHN